MIFLFKLVQLIFTLLNLIIIVRVLLSWLNPNPYHPAVVFIYKVTEPILRPIRSILPTAGGLDFSPVVALILLWLGQQLILSLLARLI